MDPKVRLSAVASAVAHFAAAAGVRNALVVAFALGTHLAEGHCQARDQANLETATDAAAAFRPDWALSAIPNEAVPWTQAPAAHHYCVDHAAAEFLLDETRLPS